LNRRKALGRNQQQQGETLRPIRQPRRDQTDRLHRDRLGYLQLNNPAVFLLLRIEEQESPSHHRLRFDRQPNPTRRLEPQCEIGRTQVPSA
jgi:hypothetical protein